MSTIINQIDNDTWIFEESSVRFFLLTGREKALLIDSGMQTTDARGLAQSLTSLPLELLCTHADPDHINCNAQFPYVYMHPAEGSNYYNTQKRTGEIRPVWDGDVIDLGDRPLAVIHIPGHTPGSIAILDVKHRRLFSGDPIQDGGIFMFGPQREMHSYRHSLRRLQDQTHRFDAIYPSHGSCPVKPELIEELYDAAGDVLDGRIQGKDSTIFNHPVREYDVGAARFLCDR